MANGNNIPYIVNDTTPLPDGTGALYQTTLMINNFPTNQTILNPNDIFSIGVNMEHSYAGDLSIKIICPNGQFTNLLSYQNGLSEHFLGEPIDNDLNNNHGEGYFYNWTTHADSSMSDITNHHFLNFTGLDDSLYTNQKYIPAGNYLPQDLNFNNLIGCPINGLWKIEVIDHLSSDDGFIFSWQINFDSLLIPSGYNLGNATLLAGGGTPPYTYYWSNGMTTPFINNLAPGTYYVTVQDSYNGNSTTLNKQLINNPHISKNKVTIIQSHSLIPDIPSLPTLSSQCEIISLTAPTATDNTYGTIIGTNSTTLPITQNTTITWNYDNGHGNTTTQNQNIIIYDTIPPSPDNITLPIISNFCSVQSLTPPTATDNCEGQIIGTHTTSLPIIENTTITWMFQDSKGNTSTQTQDFIILNIDTSVTINNLTLSSNQQNATYQWIDCDNGNSPIIGATNQYFTLTTNNNYALIVSKNGCVDTTNCYSLSSVNIIENKIDSKINIYPNPTSNIINIQTNEFINSINIQNILGEIVQYELNKSFSIENLSNGIYLIRIRTFNDENIFRIVKE